MAKKILLMGDSITDASRDHENPFNMGHGYATLVASALGVDYPARYECLNRGISGNRIVDVYARIKRDFINLQPDYASIYIGVNDTWHEIWERNGVATDKFEMVYHLLLAGHQADAYRTLRAGGLGHLHRRGASRSL